MSRALTLLDERSTYSGRAQRAADLILGQAPRALDQLRGQFYIEQLAKTQPLKKELLAKIGDIFWFDQHRNLGTAIAVPAMRTI